MVRTAEQRRLYESKQITRRRAILHSLKDKPCTDRGQRYPPYVMHFDHREGEEKLFNLAHYVSGGAVGKGKVRARGIRIELLLVEASKCDVLCSNCHTERTWGSGRLVNNGVS